MTEGAARLFFVALWSLALLFVTFRNVTDGSIEQVCENERQGGTDESTVRRLRWWMYGSAYLLAILGAILLSDAAGRIWRALRY